MKPGMTTKCVEAHTQEEDEPYEELEAAASDVIRGLEAPDSGQARAEDVDAWLVAVGGFDSLVSELTPTTTSSSTTTVPDTTAVEVTTTSTAIPIAADDRTSSDGNSGWVLLVALAAVGAYLLGRRRGSNT